MSRVTQMRRAGRPPRAALRLEAPRRDLQVCGLGRRRGERTAASPVGWDLSVSAR